MDGLSLENLWWRANPQSNSIGNLILHLSGNLQQWIVSGVGGLPDVRERRREFDERNPTPGAELLSLLRATVVNADAVLTDLDPGSLLEHRPIQTYDVTVLQAIYAVVEHFSMHTGQIILLAKMWKPNLSFYDRSGGEPRPTWKGGVVSH
jgi:uncharacterized damage-inducible protein DinB